MDSMWQVLEQTSRPGAGFTAGDFAFASFGICFRAGAGVGVLFYAQRAVLFAEFCSGTYFDYGRGFNGYDGYRE